MIWGNDQFLSLVIILGQEEFPPNKVALRRKLDHIGKVLGTMFGSINCQILVLLARSFSIWDSQAGQTSVTPASFDISSVFCPVKTPGAELSLPRADHPCVHSLGTFIRYLSRPWRCHWLGQTGALPIGDLLSSWERSNVPLVSFDVVFSRAPTPTQLQPFCLSCCLLNLFNPVSLFIHLQTAASL